MVLVDILAIYGAAVGTLSAGVQASVLWRDRPQLTVGAGATTHRGERPQAWIEVHNHGTRPTTVREVGFSAGPTSFEVPQKGLSGSGNMTFAVSKDFVFLEPGQTVRLQGTPRSVDYGYHADHPLRPYAIDGRNRYVWGKAGAVIRWLIGPEPPISPEDPPGFTELLRPSREPILPKPVEPWWKLWKPREQRFARHYRP